MKPKYIGKWLSATLALALLASLLISNFASPQFRDVPDDYWAAGAIEDAVAGGIVGGYADGTFRPYNSVSFGAFSLMLARAFYNEELQRQANPNAPATAVSLMTSHGALSHTKLDSGEASKNTAIERQDMAMLMYNIMRDLGLKIVLPEGCLNSSWRNIKDYSELDTYHKAGVAVCYDAGILGGRADGTFGGSAAMNRAQACVVISRLQEYIADYEAPVEPETPETPVTPEPDPDEITSENARLTNGKPVTVENVQELIDELRRTKYPDGYTYDPKEPYDPNVGWGGKTNCDKFAWMFSDDIWGDLPGRRVNDVKTARPGDILIYYDRNGVGYHADIVVSGVDENGVIRTNGGGEDGITYHDDPLRPVDPAAKNVVVVTRYPKDVGGFFDWDATDFEEKIQEQYDKAAICANCGYVMHEPGSFTFDSNGDYYKVCDICHDWYLCGQCLSDELMAQHKATCNG